MDFVSGAVEELEERLPKVIDATTHGLIDYGHSLFFLGMAWFLRKRNPRAAAAALGTGVLVLGEALLTDYPMGLGRVIPFEQHGQLDSGFAAVSLLMPRLFGFEGTAAGAVFKANALVEATVVGLTDFDSERAREQKAI
jgi:hypothetical protein